MNDQHAFHSQDTMFTEGELADGRSDLSMATLFVNSGVSSGVSVSSWGEPKLYHKSE